RCTIQVACCFLNTMIASFNHHQPPVIENGIEAAPHNRLLQDLLQSEFASDLLADARIVSLKTNQVLYERGDEIKFIYFPLNSVVSNLAITEDGTTVETSMVGLDGLVGISAILGSGFSKQWSWVLIDGETVQVEARNLDKLLLRNEGALKLF